MFKPKVSGPRTPSRSTEQWFRHKLWSESSCVTLDKLLSLSGLQSPLLQYGIIALTWESPREDQISSYAHSTSSRNGQSKAWGLPQFPLATDPEMRIVNRCSREASRETGQRRRRCQAEVSLAPSRAPQPESGGLWSASSTSEFVWPQGKGPDPPSVSGHLRAAPEG